MSGTTLPPNNDPRPVVPLACGRCGALVGSVRIALATAARWTGEPWPGASPALPPGWCEADHGPGEVPPHWRIRGLVAWPPHAPGVVVWKCVRCRWPVGAHAETVRDLLDAALDQWQTDPAGRNGARVPLRPVALPPWGQAATPTPHAHRGRERPPGTAESVDVADESLDALLAEFIAADTARQRPAGDADLEETR